MSHIIEQNQTRKFLSNMPATNENSSLKLLRQDLYQRHYDDSARTEYLERSYLRARQLARHHGKMPSPIWTPRLTSTSPHLG